MESKIATYQIEIIKEPFKLEHISCEQTVLVKTFIENKLVSQIKYGLVDKEEVYKQEIGRASCRERV